MASDLSKTIFRTFTPRAHTKVVATIGPSSEGRIGELIDAGLSVARLNFSHGAPEDHARRANLIREEAASRRATVGILADIQGPKLRLGLFEEGVRRLKPGEQVLLMEGDGLSGPGEILFNIEGFTEAVEPGHRVFLADGAVELRVEDRKGGVLVGRIRRGGIIGDRKGFHLPDSSPTLAMPTPKDIVDLAQIHELGVDMIGASYISTPAEIRRIRKHAPDAAIVAKIERAEAVQNIEEILAETDGIMVARGDLGVELELERLPMVQKALLRAARRAGKFTITATEMLESMVNASRPTRAEVTDIANAVLDGTDAVMLSAETAVGQYPVEAVATMVRIAAAVESSDDYRELPRIDFRATERDFSNAIAHSAVDASRTLNIRKIVAFTETGNSVRQISRYRPTAEIFALSPNERTVQSMSVLAHVWPYLFEHCDNLEHMLMAASSMLLERGLCRLGEEVLFVAGVPAGVSHSTNVMKLHRIGEDVVLH